MPLNKLPCLPGSPPKAAIRADRGIVEVTRIFNLIHQRHKAVGV